MPESIHGFKIGSSEYLYDYTYLSNKPESIPTYDTDGSDDGKVLVVDNNQLSWETPPGLPDPGSASVGLVLRVSDSYEAAWEEINEVPDNSSGEEGYVLTADGLGGYTWEELTTQLPSWGHEDNGKVLTIVYSAEAYPEWKEIIPITYSHESYDRVLTIPAGLTEPEWKSILPYYDSDDAGKVLSVNSEGELEWISLS